MGQSRNMLRNFGFSVSLVESTDKATMEVHALLIIDLLVLEIYPMATPSIGLVISVMDN